MAKDIDDLEPVNEVGGEATVKAPRMDTKLAQIVANFTPLQKRYADYRAKGLKQADAALKAGSRASGRSALGRVGYNFEQLDGMKEYISYLYEKRARASVVDEIELVEKLRMVFEQGLEEGNLNASNKAVELMGLMIGAFKREPTASTSKSTTSGSEGSKTKNNLDAFKQEGEDLSPSDKLKSISSLVKSMNLDTSK